MKLKDRVETSIKVIEDLLADGWSMQYAKGVAKVKSKVIMDAIRKEERYNQIIKNQKAITRTSVYGHVFLVGKNQYINKNDPNKEFNTN